MKKRILLFMVLLMSVMRLSAHDFLRAVKDSIPDGYNFWVYTPIDYFYSQEQTPVVISTSLRAYPIHDTSFFCIKKSS